MTTITPRSVRHAFLMFLMALTFFAVAESVAGNRAAAPGDVAEGLSSCGTIDAPCTLEAVAVTVPARAPAAPRLAAVEEGLSECGTEAQPCRLETVEVTAPAASGRLASLEQAVGMTLRVRS